MKRWYFQYIFFSNWSNMKFEVVILLTRWSICTHIIMEMKSVANCVSPGPHFNIKKSSYQYRKSHCGWCGHNIQQQQKNTTICLWINLIQFCQLCPGKFSPVVKTDELILEFYQATGQLPIPNRTTLCHTTSGENEWWCSSNVWRLAVKIMSH